MTNAAAHRVRPRATWNQSPRSGFLLCGVRVREMANELKQPWMFPATEGQAKAAMAGLGLVVAAVIIWLVVYGPGFRAVRAAVTE